MDRFFIFTALLAAFWLLSQWSGEVSHGPGVLVPSVPEQSNYRKDPAEIRMDKWQIQPVAEYRVDARVLEIQDYDEYDIDELVPLDFLLGWGPMSDSAVIQKLDLGISNRYATWRWWGSAPLPKDVISEHASNHHLLPATPAIRQQLQSVRVGDIITLRGELVNIRSSTGREQFRSSLTRKDSGPGACEVMLVKSVGIR